MTTDLQNIIIDHIRRLVTMNDQQFSVFAIGLLPGDPVQVFTALMQLVNDGSVIISDHIDATGRTIGGVYSLPGSMQKQ